MFRFREKQLTKIVTRNFILFGFVFFFHERIIPFYKPHN